MVSLEKEINSALGKQHDLNVDPKELDDIHKSKTERIYKNLMKNFETVK